METPQYSKLADECLEKVAAWLEDFDPDELDFTPSDGVLTMEFADGAKFVLNRQSAAGQMWFAAVTRAWHFDWVEEREAWIDDKEGADLFRRIEEAVSEKLGRPVAM
jgi:CyaY protein